MNYLASFFASTDSRQAEEESSSKLTPLAYSVAFKADGAKTLATTKTAINLGEANRGRSNKITIQVHGGHKLKDSIEAPLLDRRVASTTNLISKRGGGQQQVNNSFASYQFVRATIKLAEDTIADNVQTIKLRPTSVHSLAPIEQEEEEEEEDKVEVEEEKEDDWILIGDELATGAKHWSSNNKNNNSKERKRQKEQRPLTLRSNQMALDKNDVELIKASWIPVAKNPIASGVLLFKGLFTKFPQYLKFFPQFADLDLEHMQENKRLLKHAVKVIETVTYVVDSIGDESKASKLNEALEGLVKSHLRRRIGLAEFRNLGIVLIDFICDVNHRRGASPRPDEQQQQLRKSSSEDSSSQSNSIESETMTNALDKVRTSSSPSSMSEEESYSTAGQANKADEDNQQQQVKANSSCQTEESSANNEAKIDTNLLVASWTKLYSSILDLVKREEEIVGANK